MNLGEALEREMGRLWDSTEKIRSAVSSARGRAARITALEKAHGGPAGAARAVGVGPQTWRRWKKTGGQAPSQANLRRLDAAYQDSVRASRQRAFRARLRRSRPVVTAVVRWSNSKPYNRIPHRTVHLNPIDMMALEGPWLLGDKPLLAETFEEAVQGAYRADEIRFEGDAVAVTL